MLFHSNAHFGHRWIETHETGGKMQPVNEIPTLTLGIDGLKLYKLGIKKPEYVKFQRPLWA